MAVPFDPQRLTVTGTPVVMVDGVRQSPSGVYAQYGISGTGSLVYEPGGTQATSVRLVWVDRKGQEQALPLPDRAYQNPRLSPEGQRVAMMISEPRSNIFVYDLARDAYTQLTFQGFFNLLGAWTPDGKRVAFGSIRGGPTSLFWQLADGSGSPDPLISGEYDRAPSSWSPDGLLAFIEINPTTARDIWVLRISDHKALPFLNTQLTKSAPQFSPDGHWLAYVSDNRAAMRHMCSPIRPPGGNGQSRPTAARSRCGTQTGGSCSIAAGTR